MNASKRLIAALLLVVASACHDSPTSVSNGIVTVRREADGIRITNQTTEARAYSAYDQDWLALADLSLVALCATTDSACLRLPANGSVLMPFSEVGGYSASTKTIVVWTWRVMPNGAGGLQAVMDEAITLKL